MTTANRCYLSASALAWAIGLREVSAVEAMTAHLQRIEQLNPTLNSVEQIAPGAAVALAYAADEALARGQPFGPLHSVPFTVKAVFEVGAETPLITAPGMAAPLHAAAERDSTAVRHLHHLDRSNALRVTYEEIGTSRKKRIQ